MSIACTPDSVSCYVNSLFQPDDWVEIRRVWEGQGNSIWHRASDIADAIPSLLKDNAAGKNIYIGVNPRPAQGINGDKNIKLARCLFVDFDHVTNVEEIQGRIAEKGLPVPSMLINSGHGFHAYWLLKEPLTDLYIWTGTQRALAEVLGSDEKVINPERIMRVPGFANVKDAAKPVPCQFVEHNAGRNYTLSEIAEPLFAAKKTQPAVVSKSKARQSAPPVPEVIAEGRRNDTLASLAGSMNRRGMSRDAILSALKIENLQKCNPPLPEGEVVAIVDSITSLYDPAASHLLTDIGNARRFIRDHGDEVRYCHTWHSWFIFDGRHWERDESGIAVSLAMKTALSMHHEAAASPDTSKAIAQHALRSQSRERLMAMLDLAKPGLAIAHDQFDSAPHLLNVANGTIDLRTGELRPHNKDDFITKISPVEYDPAATCPTFDSFLKWMFDAAKDALPYVQKAGGYACTGYVKEQCLFFLHGDGSNGKSTLMDILIYVLGSGYAAKTDPELLIARNGDSAHPTNVADLVGKRVVVCSETERGRRFDESRLKDLTGERYIKARFMRQDFFQFLATFKIFLYSNHKVTVRGTDEGIWRRIKLIPFKNRIDDAQKDTSLPEKLQSEAPGVLRWLIEGAVRWHKEGIGKCPSVEDSTKEYRREMDTFSAFLERYCEFGKNLTVSADDLYGAYRQWCEQDGEYCLSQNKFGRTLSERGFQREHKRAGDIWHGIKLKQNDEDGDDWNEPLVKGRREVEYV